MARKKWCTVVRRLTALALAPALGCSDTDRAASPTAPISPASRQIFDGANQGNPHFFFLPPLVKQPTSAGTSDPTASPTVLVCEWVSAPGAPNRCGDVIALFTMAATAGSESIQYDAESETYAVNWKTDRCVTGACALDPQKQYRIRVLIGATELGHADVDVVSNGNELKNVETSRYIPLLGGRTLPIKFRIERGAVALVEAGVPATIGIGGGEVASSDGQVSLSIPPDAVGGPTPISISAPTTSRPGTGAWSSPIELGPDGTTFSKPVELSIGYDVTKLPEGVIPEALKLSTWVVDHWEDVPGSTLNVSDATVSASISHFSSYALVIWPNAVRGASDAQQLVVGQRTTFTGSYWVWQTVPARYCYTTRVWVRTFYGGYWRYSQQCYTYTTTNYYYPTGAAVFWQSSVPSVASVAAPGYSLTTNGITVSPAVTANAPGSAIITGRIGTVSSSVTMTVLPSLVLDVFASGTIPFRKFGFRQGTGMNVRIPSALGNALTVTLSHSHPSVASSNASLPIPTGSTQNGVTIIAGTVAGRDTVIATAPGFGADTLVIETGTGRLLVDGLPTSLAFGDSAVIRIRPMNQDSTIIDNAWLTTFNLASDGKLVFSRANAAITNIAVPDGTSSTPTFYVKAVGSGAATMTVTNPYYISGPYTVSVGPPPFTSIRVQPNPAGVRPGQAVPLTATALDAANQSVAGVTLTWSSSNTAVATVNQSGLVTGVADGVVTISASNASVIGSAIVRVGIPSIAPLPGSATIPVQQGQTNQVQIAINNGGGGLLSGLQAGSFSNYFNGSEAPWVTATFNTTTAPAIMTITATPGLTIPAGVHQLRFDVSAPGASNSPFTFYQINITVIQAGVTPVNATIAPSVGSFTLTVPAGQSRQSQLTINNSGTDPLRALSAGPFSNYYNGEAYPWIVASFASTTAPAPLTITASPGANVPPGDYVVRFEVASPGATNSPYTFFVNHVIVTAPVDPPFLAGGGKSTCALRPDKTVLCWGETSYGATGASTGTFSTIGGGFFHYCGIRPDQSLNCWGYNSDLRATPPSTGAYNRISVGPEHNCALRTDNTAVCWGFGGDGRSSPPSGSYKQIGVGWYHSCGVRLDDTAVCWGQNGSGQSTAPGGTFKSVSGGAYFTCGIRTDDGLQCWGSIPTPPSGTFVQLASASAGGHACAIRTNGTLACWGQNDFGQASPPSGQYLQVVTNYLQSCAVRSDRIEVCWGSGATGATTVPAEFITP